jgi:tripartite-type tricarboxylate transporter receptor subunit TctC
MTRGLTRASTSRLGPPPQGAGPPHIVSVGRVEPACETRHDLLLTRTLAVRRGVSGLAKSLYPTYVRRIFSHAKPLPQGGRRDGQNLGDLTRRQALALAGAGFCAALNTRRALAQTTPTWPKQITLVVPFPPGASNDIFARILAQKLAPRLNATIIVDNKPGAGGTIGAAHVTRQPANGSTLMLSSISLTGAAAVMEKIPYDPIKDFTCIAQLAKGPLILAVSPMTPFQSAADVIAAAKAAPKTLNFATSGVGSINHMATEMLISATGIEMTHIPYKGTAGAITDLIGGQTQLTIASIPSLVAQLKAGKVRGLAVTSLQKSPFVPDLPPLADTVPGFEIELWWGMFAPAGLPQAMVDHLNAELQTIITDPEMRERFAQEGAAPTPGTASDFAKVVKTDLEAMRTLARTRNISAE